MSDPIFDMAEGLDKLKTIMARLRDPQTGCPWDIEQNFRSIAPYTIEEAYEVSDAIEREAWAELEGELGDLLLQVIYHSQMAEEAGHFTLQSVIEAISAKMINRHPHVFGDESRDKSAAQQTLDWETQKAKERGTAGVLDGVALALPALMRAIKLQKRAARVGFDWPTTDQVLDKLLEEAGELRDAPKEHQAEEFGDLLFVMVNLGRHLGIDSEEALRGTNDKFTRRFNHIEQTLKAQGSSPKEASLEEMDALWDEAKAREKG